MPFSGENRGMTFTIVGQPMPPAGLEPSASHLLTDGSYFRAMQIPLKNGRTFDAHEPATSKPVIMVNEEFVKKFVPESESDWSSSAQVRMIPKPRAKSSVSDRHLPARHTKRERGTGILQSISQDPDRYSGNRVAHQPNE